MRARRQTETVSGAVCRRDCLPANDVEERYFIIDLFGSVEKRYVCTYTVQGYGTGWIHYHEHVDAVTLYSKNYYIILSTQQT